MPRKSQRVLKNARKKSKYGYPTTASAWSRNKIYNIPDVVNSSDELSSETRKSRSAKKIQDAIRRRNNRRRSRAATRIQSSARTLTPKTQRKMLRSLAREKAFNQGVDPNTGYPRSLEGAYIGLKPFEEARLRLQSRYGERRPNMSLPERYYDTPNTTPNTTSTQFNTGLGSNTGATSYAPLSAIVKDLGLVANAVSEMAEDVAEKAGSALQSNEAQGLAMMAKDTGAALLSMLYTRKQPVDMQGARYRYNNDGVPIIVQEDQTPYSQPGGGKSKKFKSNKLKRNKYSSKRIKRR